MKIMNINTVYTAKTFLLENKNNNFHISLWIDKIKQNYEKVYGFKFKEYEYKYNKLENQDKNDKYIVNFNMKSTELNWKIHRELFQ